jgi:hypothetical protein
MTDRNLTSVEIAFYPEYLNYRLRFGSPIKLVRLDRSRSLAFFKPSRVFGYLRWYANESGTQAWRFTVAEAKEPHIMLSRLQGIKPGAEVLLLLSGAAHVRRALSVVDDLETRGFKPEDVSPSYYRHLHVRLSTGRDIRPYSVDQHAAHLAARRLQ